MKKYFIKRIFNNNAVLATNKIEAEVILLGKGLAFNKKRGDLVDSNRIEKVFKLDVASQQKKLFSLLKEVPSHHIAIVSHVIKNAQEKLKTQFDDDIYISLTDHISFAIKRSKQNISLPNMMLGEIKKYYYKEFETAVDAVKYINYHEKTALDENEAGFIAMHFVNAEVNNEYIDEQAKIQDTVKEIIRIVEKYFNKKFDQQNLDYLRFKTHIEFFLKRLFSNNMYNEEVEELYTALLNNNSKVCECVNEIDIYINHKFHYKLTKDEYAYFVLHITRTINR